ncbi:hypothetical protein ACIBTV_04300 [Micromonospora sp. NPDC049366]|uniref:hypothetical protein n=1 Tax=Micromonospora sp. NPDC049366 TaxID=3364271 RepID=UPI0037AE0F4D
MPAFQSSEDLAEFFKWFYGEELPGLQPERFYALAQELHQVADSLDEAGLEFLDGVRTIRSGVMGAAEEAFVDSSENVAESLGLAPDYVRTMAQMMNQFSALFNYVIITVMAITALLLFELIVALKLFWINPALLMEWLAKAPAVRQGLFRLFMQLTAKASLGAAFNIIYELLVDVFAQLMNRAKRYQRGWNNKNTGDAVASGALESLVGGLFGLGKGGMRRLGSHTHVGGKSVTEHLPTGKGGKALGAGAGLAGNAGEEVATEVVVGGILNGQIDTNILGPTAVSSLLNGLTFGGIGAGRDALTGSGRGSDGVPPRTSSTPPTAAPPDTVAGTDPVPAYEPPPPAYEEQPPAYAETDPHPSTSTGTGTGAGAAAGTGTAPGAGTGAAASTGPGTGAATGTGTALPSAGGPGAAASTGASVPPTSGTPGTRTDPQTDVDPQSGLQADTQTVPPTAVTPESVPQIGVSPQSGLQAGAQSGASPQSGVGVQLGAQAGPQTGVGMQSGAEAGVSPQSGSEVARPVDSVAPVSGPGPGPVSGQPGVLAGASAEQVYSVLAELQGEGGLTLAGMTSVAERLGGGWSALQASDLPQLKSGWVTPLWVQRPDGPMGLVLVERLGDGRLVQLEWAGDGSSVRTEIDPATWSVGGSGTVLRALRDDDRLCQFMVTDTTTDVLPVGGVADTRGQRGSSVLSAPQTTSGLSLPGVAAAGGMSVGVRRVLFGAQTPAAFDRAGLERIVDQVADRPRPAPTANPADDDRRAQLCVELLAEIQQQLYPHRAPIARAQTVTDDSRVGTGQVTDLIGGGAQWRPVGSWTDLEDSVKAAGPGSTALVLQQRSHGIGHALVLHHSTPTNADTDIATAIESRLHWLEPQNPPGDRLLNGPDRETVHARLGAPLHAHAIILDPTGTASIVPTSTNDHHRKHVIATTKRPTNPSESTAHALIDAPLDHRYGAPRRRPADNDLPSRSTAGRRVTTGTTTTGQSTTSGNTDPALPPTPTQALTTESTETFPWRDVELIFRGASVDSTLTNTVTGEWADLRPEHAVFLRRLLQIRLGPEPIIWPDGVTLRVGCAADLGVDSLQTRWVSEIADYFTDRMFPRLGIKTKILRPLRGTDGVWMIGDESDVIAAQRSKEVEGVELILGLRGHERVINKRTKSYKIIGPYPAAFLSDLFDVYPQRRWLTGEQHQARVPGAKNNYLTLSAERLNDAFTKLGIGMMVKLSLSGGGRGVWELLVTPDEQGEGDVGGAVAGSQVDRRHLAAAVPAAPAPLPIYPSHPQPSSAEHDVVGVRDAISSGVRLHRHVPPVSPDEVVQVQGDGWCLLYSTMLSAPGQVAEFLTRTQPDGVGNLAAGMVAQWLTLMAQELPRSAREVTDNYLHDAALVVAARLAQMVRRPQDFHFEAALNRVVSPADRDGLARAVETWGASWNGPYGNKFLRLLVEALDARVHIHGSYTHAPYGIELETQTRSSEFRLWRGEPTHWDAIPPQPVRTNGTAPAPSGQAGPVATAAEPTTADQPPATTGDTDPTSSPAPTNTIVPQGGPPEELHPEFANGIQFADIKLIFLPGRKSVIVNRNTGDVAPVSQLHAVFLRRLLEARRGQGPGWLYGNDLKAAYVAELGLDRSKSLDLSNLADKLNGTILRKVGIAARILEPAPGFPDGAWLVGNESDVVDLQAAVEGPGFELRVGLYGQERLVNSENTEERIRILPQTALLLEHLLKIWKSGSRWLTSAQLRRELGINATNYKFPFNKVDELDEAFRDLRLSVRIHRAETKGDTWRLVTSAEHWIERSGGAAAVAGRAGVPRDSGEALNRVDSHHARVREAREAHGALPVYPGHPQQAALRYAETLPQAPDHPDPQSAQPPNPEQSLSDIIEMAQFLVSGRPRFDGFTLPDATEDWALSPVDEYQVRRPFALWVRGEAEAPGRVDSTMSSSEAIFLWAWYVGLISEDWLRGTHAAATAAAKNEFYTSGEDISALRQYIASMTSSLAVNPQPYFRHPAGGTGGQRPDGAQQHLQQPIPAGYVVLFNGLEHVAISLGTRDPQGHQEIFSPYFGYTTVEFVIDYLEQREYSLPGGLPMYGEPPWQSQ